uniref:Choline transporter-like protein n=1 Tax=Guillardia theta TaxID=55529 RepID=A0A7S4PPC4_GUITH|mmetsp:Transcript_7915/g.26478  ORF Transcript_7915/g.26478 Transcript_7915/m.26478 type:complete len:921 (+) Transcript_7915:100-2862(+)
MGDDEQKFGDKETDVPSPETAKRSCRDLLCLIVFLLAWAVWIVLALMVFTDGCPNHCNDPMKLVYGTDSNGCMCGRKCTDLNVDNTGKKRLYLPDPRDPYSRLCLATCPTAFAFTKDEAVKQGTYVCAGNACMLGGASVWFYNQNKAGGSSVAAPLDNCFLPTSNSTNCWYPSYPTIDVLYKCIPSLPANISTDSESLQAAGLPSSIGSFGDSLSTLQSPGGSVGQYAAELSQTWQLIIIGMVIALVLGFVFLLLVRFFAVAILWIVIIGLFIVLAACSLFAWDRTGKISIFSKFSDQSNITALAEASGVPIPGQNTDTTVITIFAAIFSALFVIYLVLLIILFKRILLAVKVIVEAAKAIAAMPFLILQPLTTFISLGVLYVWVILIAMYLFSAGKFDPVTGKFEYGGGNCVADLTNYVFTINFTTSLITLMKNSSTTQSSATGIYTITHPSLRGQECSTSSITSLERCKLYSNTTKSDAFPVGTCLGNYSANTCVKDILLASKIYNKQPESERIASSTVWSPAAGSLSFYLNAESSSTFRFVANIRNCSDGKGCGSWDISGAFGSADFYGSWKLETVVVQSNQTILNQDATRWCNLYSTTDLALNKIISSKIAALIQQGKADVNEINTVSLFNVTTDNWKSILPVALDGNTYKYFCLYHLFMFLWTSNFTISSSYFIVAGAVASWYWTLDKKANLKKHPVFSSTSRYVRYNLGTVALGSFIIAVVQFIRIIINYYLNQCKKLEHNPALKRLIAVMQCIINCCMWCIEKVIGFINKTAYVMAATHGYSFCKGAWKGFLLIMRNILQIAAINMITPFFLLLGKLFITLATLAICYLIAQSYSKDVLPSGAPFFTLLIVAITAWYAAGAFIGVFEAAIDCILLSFLHDSEVNDGKDKPYFMADSLKSSLGVSNKVSPTPDS